MPCSAREIIHAACHHRGVHLILSGSQFLRLLLLLASLAVLVWVAPMATLPPVAAAPTMRLPLRTSALELLCPGSSDHHHRPGDGTAGSACTTGSSTAGNCSGHPTGPLKWSAGDGPSQLRQEGIPVGGPWAPWRRHTGQRPQPKATPLAASRRSGGGLALHSHRLTSDSPLGLPSQRHRRLRDSRRTPAEAKGTRRMLGNSQRAEGLVPSMQLPLRRAACLYSSATGLFTRQMVVPAV